MWDKSAENKRWQNFVFLDETHEKVKKRAKKDATSREFSWAISTHKTTQKTQFLHVRKREKEEEDEETQF